MNGEILFQTNRLYVRQWRADDMPKVLALYRDPEVIRWVDDGQPLSLGDAKKWMEVTRANYTMHGYGMFAIDDRDSHETLGFGGIVHPGNQPEPEIKYALNRAFWGQGIATEFVRGLTQYAQTQHNVRRFIATIARVNKASARVLTKSGFRHNDTRIEDDGSATEIYVWSAPQ